MPFSRLLFSSLFLAVLLFPFRDAVARPALSREASASISAILSAPLPSSCSGRRLASALASLGPPLRALDDAFVPFCLRDGLLLLVSENSVPVCSSFVSPLSLKAPGVAIPFSPFSLRVSERELAFALSDRLSVVALRPPSRSPSLSWRRLSAAAPPAPPFFSGGLDSVLSLLSLRRLGSDVLLPDGSCARVFSRSNAPFSFPFVGDVPSETRKAERVRFRRAYPDESIESSHISFVLGSRGPAGYYLTSSSSSVFKLRLFVPFERTWTEILFETSSLSSRDTLLRLVGSFSE